MDWYTLVKFLHVTFAIVWLGGGFGLVILGIRASVAADPAAMFSVVKDVVFLANRVFVPSSLVVLACGVTMAILGQSFATLWIIIGLAGFAATFTTGLLILKPLADRITKDVADGMPPSATAARCGRLLQIAKFDYVMLFVVVADMVLKPTPGDVGLLGAMALVIVAGALLFLAPRGREDAPASGHPIRSE